VPAIIDVSQWQGEINWAAIKADAIQLAIIKATEGIGFTDPRFVQNWLGAKAAGVARGAYHFARPDLGSDPTAEARYFLGVVQAHGLDLTDLLAEDYEVPGGGAAWSLAFLGTVQASTNRIPPFYSNYSGCARVNDPRMAAFPLWLAFPGDGLHAPAPPVPWTSIALWQYGIGNVPGIVGNTDEDVSLGLFGGASQSPIQGERMKIISADPATDPPGYVPPHGVGAVFVTDGVFKMYIQDPLEMATFLALAGQAAPERINQAHLDRLPEILPQGNAGTAQLDVAALMAAVGKINTGGSASVDLGPVLTAIADLKAHPTVLADPVLLAKVTAIEANLNAPRPPA
jgi:lysozyme